MQQWPGGPGGAWKWLGANFSWRTASTNGDWLQSCDGGGTPCIETRAIYKYKQQRGGPCQLDRSTLLGYLLFYIDSCSLICGRWSVATHQVGTKRNLLSPTEAMDDDALRLVAGRGTAAFCIWLVHYILCYYHALPTLLAGRPDRPGKPDRPDRPDRVQNAELVEQGSCVPASCPWILLQGAFHTWLSGGPVQGYPAHAAL